MERSVSFSCHPAKHTNRTGSRPVNKQVVDEMATSIENACKLRARISNGAETCPTLPFFSGGCINVGNLRNSAFQTEGVIDSQRKCPRVAI